VISLNVLVLSETFYPHFGGAELATYLYCKLLSDNGFNVSVITNRHEGEPSFSNMDNFKIYRLNIFNDSKSTKYSILSRVDINVSDFFNRMVDWSDAVYIPRLWFSAIPFVKKRKKPVIVHLHDYFPICPLSNRYDFSTQTLCNNVNGLCSMECIWAYEKRQNRTVLNSILSLGINSLVGKNVGGLVESSDAIICVSKAHRNILVKNLPKLREKTHYVYNPLPELPDIELKNDDFGFFGGFNALKGVHVLLGALKFLKKNSDETIRMHATKFSEFRSDYFANSNIDLIKHGRLSLEEFNLLYERIGTVLVPSVWPEPLPYVVLEALLRGRALIASNIGGITEEVNGCKGVVLCDPGDELELADAIIHVRSYSKEDRLEWKNYNRNILLKKFDDKKNLDKFIRVFEEIV